MGKTPTTAHRPPLRPDLHSELQHRSPAIRPPTSDPFLPFLVGITLLRPVTTHRHTSAHRNSSTVRHSRPTSPSLHPMETILIVLAGTLLCFMPWALGTMHVWSQFVSLGFACLAFAVAVTNRRYLSRLIEQEDFHMIMWRKLIQFPLFWIGLLLLSYVLTQALNPAWTYVTQNNFWWMQQIPHIKWLPSGMVTPYQDMNAWRVLVIWGTVWLLGCALWIGITRRKSITILLTIITANGALWALVGILQKVTHANQVLWGTINRATPYFFSTILYKNHAGAYLNLLLMLGVAIAWWYSQRSERRLTRTSPGPFFIFLVAVMGIGVLLTNCKAAALLLAGFVICSVGTFTLYSLLRRDTTANPALITLSSLGLVIGLGLAGYFLNIGQSIDRVSKFLKEGGGDNFRDLGRIATWDMAKDNLITGWGAGSFRHYFTVYQKNYPKIDLVPNHPTMRLRWEYAHNDYVQALAELGISGTLLLAAGLVWAMLYVTKRQFYKKPHLFIIALALGTTLIHAWVDFQFHNPAILLLWCSSLILFCRWSEIDARTD